MDSKISDWRPGPTVCRCCLSEGCYKDISTEYFWMGKTEVYADMLSETFNLSISYSQSGGPNSNSRLICEPCISRLRDASEFKRQVQECEKTFINHLDSGAVGEPSTASMEIEAPTLDVVKGVKLEEVKLEKQYSDDEFDCRDFGDEDDDDDLDDQPLTTFATKVPKKESVDLLDLLDNTQITVKRKSKTKDPEQSKKPKLVRKATATVKAKASVSAKKVEVKPVEKKKKGSIHLKAKWRPKSPYNDHRDNAAIVIESSNVCPFRWKRGTFVCGYCHLSFADFSDLKAHTSEHSNRVEVLRLARSYFNIKVEVSNLKCELCLQITSDLDELADHLITSHDKPIQKDRGLGVTPYIITDNGYVCAYCKEKFVVFTSMNTHLNVHNPNSICFLCGKVFSTQYKLKVHLTTHETDIGRYECSKCEQVFPSQSLKNKHQAAEHWSGTRYKCQLCGENFKSYHKRGKHLKEYHNKKVEYPCTLCPAVFAMCNQRTKHISEVHIKAKTFSCTYCPDKFVTAGRLKDHLVKHIGKRKFQCEVCKKAYARIKTLREHMRIHNDDRRFVCELCNNAYVQKCSLQSHMRTHHPNAESLKKIKLTNVV